MRFLIQEKEQSREIDVPVHDLIIAGMTGRNVEGVQNHIDELAELGISPPSTIPIFYRVSAGLLTHADRVQVVGPDSSGEVEAVLIGSNEGMLVAVGSDHTDRKLESHSIAFSKQACPKPISREVWRYTEVKEAWDDIQLTSNRVDKGEWSPYQRGTMASVRKPEDLIETFFGGLQELPAGIVMFTGTIAAVGDIMGADRFSMGLIDPTLGRALWHGYDTVVIPDIA